MYYNPLHCFTRSHFFLLYISETEVRVLCGSFLTAPASYNISPCISYVLAKDHGVHVERLPRLFLCNNPSVKLCLVRTCPFRFACQTTCTSNSESSLTRHKFEGFSTRAFHDRAGSEDQIYINGHRQSATYKKITTRSQMTNIVQLERSPKGKIKRQ